VLLVPHGAYLAVVEESDGYFGVAHGGGVSANIVTCQNSHG
jgi:hypothetical protein